MTPDVLVIGSGFGGAVIAARLAQRGLRVLVLERGPWWGPAGRAHDARERREFPRGLGGWASALRSVRWTRGVRAREWLLSRRGLYEVHAFRHLDVVTSSGVGGGSLIYTNVLEAPDDAFWGAFPPEIDAAEMRGHVDRVRAMLRPTPLPASQLPEKNRAFASATVAAGLGAPRYPELGVVFGRDPDAPETVVNAAGVAQSTCTHCGCCIIGCETRAKTTLDLTYVEVALRHGAELRPLCEVRALDRTADGWRVRYHDHRSGQDLNVTAPRLVLAAGSLNTIRLLFRARDHHRTLPGVPAALGRGFSPNGDLLALGTGASMLADASRGPALNAFVPITGEAGQRYIVGEVGTPLAGLPIPGPLRRRLARTVGLLAMGRDASRGRLEFDGRGLRTDMGRSVDPALFAEIEDRLAEVARHYGPRWLFTNPPNGRGAPRIATVHPLGGAAMATSAETGVVDHRGQVFGHPGLYVADGSVYPRAPGIPPSLTIAALAERIAVMME
ncbi:MAG: GMC family oxidoreductase [bacterium]|nr:GMC family oxidoreductase [bacterium]